MGFNNGDDSGYADCEMLNRKKWEKEAVERYLAKHPPSAAPSSTTSAAAPSAPAARRFVLDPADFAGTDFTVEGLTSNSSISENVRLGPVQTLHATLGEGENSGDPCVVVNVAPPAGGWRAGDELYVAWTYSGSMLVTFNVDSGTTIGPDPLTFNGKIAVFMPTGDNGILNNFPAFVSGEQAEIIMTGAM